MVQGRKMGCVWLAYCACSYVPLEVPSPATALVSGSGQLPQANLRGVVADSLIVLRVKNAPRLALGAVRRYLRGIRNESLEELELVLAKNATIRNRRDSRDEPAVATWEARFRRFDFRSDSIRAAARTVGVFTAVESAGLRAVRNFSLKPTDPQLLVVASWDQASVARSSQPRRVEFLVSHSNIGWTISAIVESYD